MMYRRLLSWSLPLVLILAGCANQASSQTRPEQNQKRPAKTDTARQQNKKKQADKRSKRSSQDRPQEDKPAATGQYDAAGFKRWVAGFRRRARQRGVAERTLEQAFAGARFQPRIIELGQKQPEFNQTIWKYLDTAVSQTRIEQGRKKLKSHQQTADKVAAHYGVPGAIIMAIWGMESNYGANFGDFETIDALATMGYEGRRRDMAERELYATLKILENGDISRDQMRGSWAGAMGNTQFMPTSFLTYARDGDGDGRRDIWHSVPDTMASTANYLARNGWQKDQTWGQEVQLPRGFDYTLADGKHRKSTADWQAAGVKSVDSRSLPHFESAAIIAPAGASGPAFMVGPNFQTILRYNNATSYALAVGLLADRIAGKPGVQQDWPRHESAVSRSQMRQLQTALNRLGYDTGSPDGIAGPNTYKGVRAFQRDRGMIPDGFVSHKLLQRVRRAAEG